MSETGRQRIGLSPGTLLHIGTRRLETSRLDLVSYTPDSIEERGGLSAADCLEGCRQPGIHWVNLLGIHDIPLVEQLGTGFRLNALALNADGSTSSAVTVLRRVGNSRSVAAVMSPSSPDRSRTRPWASSIAGFSWPFGPWRSSFMSLVCRMRLIPCQRR